MNRLPLVATAIASAAIVGRWLYELLPLAPLGWDAYPMLAAARIDGWDSVWGVLTGRLMGEFYPGAFYRPLASLSIGVEQALGGGGASGAVLHVALLAGIALGVYRLQARLMPGVEWAPAAAALCCLVHPVAGAVMAFLARRPDLLASLFLVWMLVVEAGRQATTARARTVSVLLAAAAMLSKETGLIAPLLVAAVAAIGTTGRRRWLAAGLRAGPHLVAGAAYLAVRFAVLGGLGGHRRGGDPSLWWGHLRDLGGGLLAPRAPALESVGWWPWALALAATVSLLAAARRASAGGGVDERAGTGAAGVVVLAAVWWGGGALLLTAAGRFSTWYPFLGLVPFSLLVGAGIGAGIDGVTAGRRAAGAVVAGLWLLVAAVAVDSSPVWTANREWRRASAEAKAFLGPLGTELDAAAPGDLLRAGRVPKVVKPADRRLRYRDAPVLAPYSIRAWASLRRPDLPVRVARRRELRREPPRDGEVTIELHGTSKVVVGGTARFEADGGEVN